MCDPPLGPVSAPASTAAPSAAGLDPQLRQWLAAGPSPCPRCRYDLSAAAQPICPECGLTLELQLLPADRVGTVFGIGAAGLALGAGLPVLFVYGSFIYAISSGNGFSDLRSRGAVLVVGAVAVAALVAWVLARRRLMRVAPRTRSTAAAVAVIFGLVCLALCFQVLVS